jgi:hypothetical protein
MKRLCFHSMEIMDEAVKQYDKDIRAIVASRAKLDATVCLLHLRVLGLQQEALILEEFVPRERALEQKLQEARNAREELEKEVRI